MNLHVLGASEVRASVQKSFTTVLGNSASESFIAADPVSQFG